MYSFGQKLLDIVSAEYGLHLENLNSWLTYPPKAELGDFAFSCFGISKELKGNPNEISVRLATAMNEQYDAFFDAIPTGGYINFRIRDELLTKDVSSIDLSIKKRKGETIVVDYIGANAGKPLHIGHLCTPSLGQSVINMYEYLGYNVISDSHFGDWGGIFGKLIYVWKNPKYLSSLEKYTNLRFDSQNNDDGNMWVRHQLNEKGVEFLLDLYQAFHLIESFTMPQMEGIEDIPVDRELGAREEFQKLSMGDLENVELWKQFTSISISEVQNQLKDELNVEAEYNIGESFYEGLDLPRPNNEDYPKLEYNMKDIVKELIDKGIARENDDGSVGVTFPEETKIPSCVLQKKDGTGLYLTSDLACLKYRMTNGWNPSKIIYFVDVRQQLHLKQAFWIAKKAWSELEKTELFHAYNGFIKLKEGAMSTRKGTVIFLKDLIEEGYRKISEILEGKGRKLDKKDIKAITVAAIKYSYLSQDREKDVVFDWEKALNFEGNSGPYIQYAYVRASKILMQSLSHEAGFPSDVGLSQSDKMLMKKLLEFDEKVLESASKYKPNIIAQYAYDLASEFNSFYVHTPKILEEKDEAVRALRLGLISKTKEILKKSFELLAMDMPDEM